MAGKWVELYDEERDRWVDCYIEFPSELKVGSASSDAEASDVSELFGANGKPLRRPPPRSIGFGRR